MNKKESFETDKKSLKYFLQCTTGNYYIAFHEKLPVLGVFNLPGGENF